MYSTYRFECLVNEAGRGDLALVVTNASVNYILVSRLVNFFSHAWLSQCRWRLSLSHMSLECLQDGSLQCSNLIKISSTSYIYSTRSPYPVNKIN